MLQFLGANHRLPLLYMAETFIWIDETKIHINEFSIIYIINPGLNFNKAFRCQVENVCILHLVKSHYILLKPHHQKTMCQH